MNRSMTAAVVAGAAFFAALPATAVRAQENDMTGAMTAPMNTLMVNGRPAMPDVEPQMIDGRMMVPVRFVAQELGANVTWEPDTQKVQLLQGTDTVTMTIGSTRASVNGMPRALAVPPVIREGRTLLPLRDVARFTGGIATYNPSTRTVFVTTRGGVGIRAAGTTNGS